MSGWTPKPGDRVMLKDPERWVLPYRRFGREQRGATVISYKPMLLGQPLLIVFDVKRKGAQRYTLSCDPRDVEHVEVVAQ